MGKRYIPIREPINPTFCQEGLAACFQPHVDVSTLATSAAAAAWRQVGCQQHVASLEVSMPAGGRPTTQEQTEQQPTMKPAARKA